MTLTFDLLTLKVVFESRVTWATPVPILVFLGLSVLDLGPMYATDRHRTKASRGGGITTLVVSILWLCHRIVYYKDTAKHCNVEQNFSHVLLALSTCVLIQKYLHVPGLDLVLGFGLRNCLLASFNITVKVIPQFLVDVEAT